MTSADYMNRTYRWMAVGLLITFAAAFVTAATPLLYVVNSLYLVFTIAELVLVYVLSSRVQNMSVGGARATFFAYALLNGMVLSYYFLVFDLGTLVLAFLATSLYFGLMAVYGTTTHKAGDDEREQAHHQLGTPAGQILVGSSAVDRSKEKVFRQKETGGVPYGLQLQWLRSRLHGACHDLG